MLEVVKGTEVADNTQHFLNQALNLSQQIDELVQSISQTTISQVETSQVVTELMQSISQSSQANSDYSQQISQSLQRTVDISKELQAAISEFKIK